MGDTQQLLTRIAGLRQRLEQARQPVGNGPAAEEGAGGTVRLLERQAAAGSQQSHLLDGALKQLALGAGPPDEGRPLPAQLTLRARRVLERGRDLLARLRPLADDLDPARPEDADPLAGLYRETVALTDTVLRTLQYLPDAASAQLRICEGLEVIVGVVAQRLTALTAALAERRRRRDQVETLADLLTGLGAGRAADLRPFAALAESVLADARQTAPLRFLHPDLKDATEPRWAARFVAGHSLTVAQVAARVVRSDADLRARAADVVLAALVHDVGMMQVPAALLAHAGPLDDAQRRSVEAHCRVGADCLARVPAAGGWLAEAAAGHHERLDGTGYPGGLRDTQLGPVTRLVAVCDVYAARCQDRPHRPALDTRTALADTLLLAEQGTLDRSHAERLLQLSFYPVGSAVELADGPVAVVVATPQGRRDPASPARPVVAVLTDAQGEPLPAPRFLDLAQVEGHRIVRSLSPAERRQMLGGRYPEWA